MRVITNKYIKETIIISVTLYNQFVTDKEIENQVNLLDFQDELKMTQTGFKQRIREIVDNMSTISLSRGDWRMPLFSYLCLDQDYNLIYRFNQQFIEVARKENFEFDYKVLDNLHSQSVIKFYLSLLENQECKFSILELEQIFDCEYKYSYVRDLYERVLKPAITDINNHSDIQITNFKKVRNEPYYKYEITRNKK